MRKKRSWLCRMGRKFLCMFIRAKREVAKQQLKHIKEVCSNIPIETKIAPHIIKNNKKFKKPLYIRKRRNTIAVRNSRMSTKFQVLPKYLEGKESVTATQWRRTIPVECWVMEGGKYDGKLLKDIPVKYIYKEAAKGTWKRRGKKWIEKGFKRLGKLPKNGTKLTMPFGKHKGKLLINVPKIYVHWLNEHKVLNKKSNKHLKQEFVRLGVLK